MIQPMTLQQHVFNLELTVWQWMEKIVRLINKMKIIFMFSAHNTN